MDEALVPPVLVEVPVAVDAEPAPVADPVLALAVEPPAVLPAPPVEAPVVPVAPLSPVAPVVDVVRDDAPPEVALFDAPDAALVDPLLDAPDPPLALPPESAGFHWSALGNPSRRFAT